MHRVAIAAGIVAAVCGIASPLCAQSPRKHVRSPELHLQKLILTAAARSASFDRLLQRLDGADVTVYLICSPFIDGPPAPRLSFVSRVNAWRYLVVRLRCPGSDDQQIVMLAHELQHAVEIADAAHVVDQRSMLLHYMRIGTEVSQGAARIPAFETTSAQTTAELVRRELSTADRPSQVAGPSGIQSPRIGAVPVTGAQRRSEP
jgi:hypothetical protein